MTRRLKALWASDGSRHVRDIAPTIQYLLSASDVEFEVLTVAPLGASRLTSSLNAGPEERSTRLLEASEIASQSASSLDLPKESMSTSVRWGLAAVQIVTEAAERGTDLVILAMKPRSRLRRMFLGDTAIEVLKATRTSVLLARPLQVDPGPWLVLCRQGEAPSDVMALLSRLDHPAQQRVVVAAFSEEPLPATSMFVSYRELTLWRMEAERNEPNDLMIQVATIASALAGMGFTVEVVLREGGVTQGLLRLASEITPSFVAISDADTVDSIDLGARLACSLLVVRP